MVNEIKIEGISVGVDVKDDGVYLLIERPAGNATPLDFGSVRALIDQCGVEDWDFSVVLETIEDTSERVERRISANTTLKVVDERIIVTVSADKMMAEVTFVAPVNNGRRLTLTDIREALHANKVIMGVDEDLMLSIANDRNFDHAYLIAKGREMIDGENGKVEFLFNTGKASYKPKELESGKLDYYNIDLFQVTTKGKQLAIITPPKDGVDGYNVLGDIKKAAVGKAALNPSGKNTTLSEDGVIVTSDIDGQVVYVNNKINVNPVLEIRGNVDTSTGNINFFGTVIVSKNVMSGFKITATGNVEVNGVVEGATINTDGNLFIRGGVQGMGKALLNVKGSLTAKFIENATVISGGDIVADSVLRSNIKCNGSMNLAGKRAQIIGGTIKVLHTVSADIIGSLMEANTEIQAGLDPDLFDEYVQKKNEVTRLKKEITQISQIIETLAKAREEGKLTQPKKAILIKSLQSRTYIKGKMSELYNEIEDIIPELTKGSGLVKVKKYINPGVKITIGNAILYVRNKLENCILSNVDGEIKVGPM